jgi:hypothetical protein
MQTTHEETLGIPPSFMTVEFINPEGKRYNFEQVVIDSDSFIEVINESGDRIILRFWQNRQSERQYPVDIDASTRYVNEVLPKIPTGIIKQQG